MASIGDPIVALVKRVADLERRFRNMRRTGTIAEIGTGDDAGKYRVKLSEQNGKPYLSDWIRTRQIGAGGVKIDVMHSVGEQVDLVSESGDLTDARIDFSTYSDSNQRANSDTPFHIKIDDTEIKASGSAVHITASKIVLDGEVHLGGEGGKALHRKGDVDSDGDVAVGAASKVFAV
jgi:phage baseplate assembly protein gpV